jgi:TPR repeat protein
MNHVQLCRVLLCAALALSVPTAQAQFASTPAEAAAPTAATPAVAPEPPYDVASKLYEQGRQKEALVILQQLAEAGDARAQYLVGLDLLEAVHLPRDNAQGLAYLLLAGEDKQWGDMVAPRAREARALVEPQLSGAELIRADALVGEYRARHPQR